MQPCAHLQAATESSDIFRRVIRAFRFQAGVLLSSDLQVTQSPTPGMSVSIAAGDCIVDGQQNSVYQGSYLCLNDAAVPLTIGPSDPTNARISLICAQVQDAQYAGSGNLWALVEIAGTPAPTPVAPALPAASSNLVLAQVTVPAAATSIVNANITDKRVPINPQPGILGTSNAIIGTSSLALGFQMQAGSVVLTTNASGVMTVTYPKPFPNGVLTVIATPGDNSGNMGMAIQSQANATLSSFQVLCVTTSGAAMASELARVNYLAIGW